MNKYFPLAVITVVEGLIGVFVKLSGDAIPIFTLNFYRVFFALLLIVGVMPLIDKNFWKIKKREIKPVVIIGGLIALQISTFNIAMKLAPIANVVVFWSTYPFFVFILSSLLLGEKATKSHVIIFLLAVLGVLIAKPFGGGSVVGNSVALLGGLIFAALITYMRSEDKTNSTGIVFWFLFFATVFLSPSLVIFGTGNLIQMATYSISSFSLTLPIIIWPISLGMISTGLAYLFITFALQRLNANIYSLVDIIVSPLIAAFFGLVILGEVPSTNLIYGGAILLISGFWLTSNLSGGIFESYLNNFHRYFKEVKKKIKSLY